MKKGKISISIFYALVLITLSAYCLILFAMVYLTAVTSLKNLPDFMANRIGLPTQWIFKNYADAFELYKQKIDGGRWVYFGEMFFNSLLYAGGCAAFATITPCLVAYCCAKYKVFLNKFIYGSVIVGMILPVVGTLPSSILVMKSLGLYDTMYGMWIMKLNYMGTYFLIFYGTFKGLSNEYKEAAVIDGAGEYTVLFKVVLPLVSGTMAAVFLLNFISFWNDYQTPLIYLKNVPTAAVGLYRFVYMPVSATKSTKPMQMTGCMIMFLPVFILFMCFRNLFMGNLTVGGIKG